MKNIVKSLFMEEEGQGMTEYGLVLGIVAIGAVVALVALRGKISTLIDNVQKSIGNNTPAEVTAAPDL